MKVSQLYGKVKRAIDDYSMIENGDKVAVGISGGKDSISLLYALHGLLLSKKVDFTIVPIMLNMGFENFDISPVKEFCTSLGLNLEVVDTKLYKLIFEDRLEKNPCSLCSTMRRGILNKHIKSLGCNKLALGHHRDDFSTTFLLSLLYEGQIKTITPTSYMDKVDITLIRPLLYISEQEIISIVNTLKLPVLKSPCPVDKKTKREEISKLIDSIDNKIPKSKERMFKALINSSFLSNIN